MDWVMLGEVSLIVSGATPSRKKPDFFTGQINWFTPKDLGKSTGKTISSSPEKITVEGLNSCSATLIPPNSLLFTSRAPIGHLAINLQECCTNQGFKSIVPNKTKLDVNYLYYCLKRNVSKIQNLGRGATFKELSKKDLVKFKIPLPPLPVQKQIAQLLDTADALRQKTQQQIELLDQLAQSIFYEMFGDPVLNEKGWESIKLEQIGKFQSGGTPSRSNPSFFEGSIPWFSTVGLGSYYITKDQAQVNITSDAIKNSAAKLIPIDSILVGVRVGVGKVSINKEVVSCSQDILTIHSIDERWSLIFLTDVIRSFSSYYVNQSRGATIKGITSKQLKSVNIIAPPKDLQIKYATIIQNIEQQKEKLAQALQHSEDLFNGLLQDIFS